MELQLPKWVKEWITAEGLSVEEFLAFLKAKAAETDVPSELIDRVSLWVQENVVAALSPTRLLAFATLVVTELRGGHPGFFPDHGGLI